MFLNYEFSNFQSFLESTTVNFCADHKARLTDWMVETPSGPVTKLMAVVGANASGKTALLKPMAFISWFISKSFEISPDALIPVASHFNAPEKPCEFKCTFFAEGRVWRYELICNSRRVLHEALYQRKERFNYLFVRDWDEASEAYEVKQKDFGLAPKQAARVRQNASLISTAAQFDVPTAQTLASLHVNTNVSVDGRMVMDETVITRAANYFASVKAQKEILSSLLSRWDLGLSDVSLREVPAPTEHNPNETRWAVMGGHISRNGRIELPFNQESSGTRGAFVLLSILLPILEKGGLAIVDEFENDLHPLMLEPILDLFGNPSTNPKNAQLIFSCHAIEVLNLLEKSQVTLVAKDDDCESSASRLDEIGGVRNDENFYAKYMAGAYGAVPRL